MPLKSGKFTPKERAFIAAYAETHNVAFAEKKAGYVKGGGFAVAKREDVQREVIATQQARLTLEALPLAVKTICDIMQDSKAPAGARVQAAKTVLDRVLPADEDGRRKEIHEMTPEELAASIAALEGQAAALARPVNDVPGEGAFG